MRGGLVIPILIPLAKGSPAHSGGLDDFFSGDRPGASSKLEHL